MARLMLSVGDMQVSVFPAHAATATAPEFQGVWASLPDGHPLKVGDHEVMFFELTPSERIGEVEENLCCATLGEAEALEVVGLWLTLETPSDARYFPSDEPNAWWVRKRLVELMGEEIKAFFP